MLNYGILNSKPEVTIVKDGEATLMKDLTTKSIKFDDISGSQLVRVNKYYVARPDLLSLVLYGTDDYGDILCKVNGISNPFELNEGMILVCPTTASLAELLVSPNYANELVSPKSKTNSNGTTDNVFKDFTTSMLSNDRIKTDLFKEKSSNAKKPTIGISTNDGKKQKNERRSPAEQTVEDTNFVINKTLGLVIY